MQIFKLEDIGGAQDAFGYNYFQIFVHDMFFLVGQFLELFKNKIELIV